MFMFTAIDASLVLLEMEIKVNNEMLEDVHCALESAISEALSRINNAVSKGDEELVEALTEGYTNQIEQLLGVAFVTAQVFITGVRTALNKVRKNCKQQKLNKEEMFKLESNLMQNLPEYTEIQVINAIANYWKHHEEWPTYYETKGDFAQLAWDKESKRDNEKQALEIVMSIGMSPTSNRNLRNAFEAFDATGSYGDLSPIRDRLRHWGHRLYERASEEVAGMKTA